MLVCMSSIRADNFIQVKQVFFNDTDYDFTIQPNTANSNWVTLGLYLRLGDFNPLYPVDITIVARGKVSCRPAISSCYD